MGILRSDFRLLYLLERFVPNAPDRVGAKEAIVMARLIDRWWILVELASSSIFKRGPWALNVRSLGIWFLILVTMVRILRDNDLAHSAVWWREADSFVFLLVIRTDRFDPVSPSRRREYPRVLLIAKLPFGCVSFTEVLGAIVYRYIYIFTMMIHIYLIE